MTAYRQARAALDLGLSDTSHSAALEQKKPFAKKPPAVILDIDETVLDNSPLQGQLILDGTGFDAKTFTEWVDKADASWVPGAKAFLDYAKSKEVKVFFVTNRPKEYEASTRRNFEKLGYDLSATEDTVLMRNEQKDWTSDKSTRRAHVAENYRVLLLMGDDLNDFIFALGSAKERKEAVMPYVDNFGADWFLLPNPLYGSWESALYERGEDCDMIDQKRSQVKGFR